MSEFSESRKGHETLASKTYRVLNSTVCFMLAYLLITYLWWFAMAAVGKFFKCDAIVYFYGIKFITPVDPVHFWDKLRILLIYSAGPLFSLLFGLLCLYIYDKTKHIKTIFNLFLLWCFFVGTSLFAAQGVIASLGYNEYNSPFYLNFSVVFSWLRIPVFLVYVFNVPFLLILIFFSSNAVKPFLKFAYSYTKINKLSRRRKYFLEVAVIPFILGSLGFVFMKYYINIVHDMFAQLTYLTTLFIGLMLAVYALPHAEVLKDDVLKYKNLQTYPIIAPILLAVLIALIYIARQGVYLSFN